MRPLTGQEIRGTWGTVLAADKLKPIARAMIPELF